MKNKVNLSKISYLKANNILVLSAKFWFISAILGQFIFAYYIAAFYGGHALNTDFKAWNKALTHGFVVGEDIGNSFLIFHILFAFIITVAGPMQFMSSIRGRFPSFHRINGRIYLFTTLIMGATGLYLTMSGRKLAGDPTQQLPFLLSGFLILIFGFFTLYTALKRNFKAHRRWALRLFLIVNGVWFFRIGLNLWLMLMGGPVGFDMETFQGPFLTILGYASFLGVFPLSILELYFLAQNSSKVYGKIVMGSLLVLLTLATLIGIYATLFGMWLPILSTSN